MSFETPLRLQALMAAAPFPWYVCGGWAIDLYLGRVTRDHHDIDLAIWRADQMALRDYLEGWRFEIAAGGGRQPWRAEDFVMLPLHELHVHHSTHPLGSFEVLLNDLEDGQWIFRRDQRITRDAATIVERTDHGIPYIAPEVVLLYKAKSPEPHDEQDFSAAIEQMSPTRQLWLHEALSLCSPGHAWLDALDNR